MREESLTDEEIETYIREELLIEVWSDISRGIKRQKEYEYNKNKPNGEC